MDRACGDEPSLFDNDTRLNMAYALFRFKLEFAPVHSWLSTFICIFGIITNIVHIFILTLKTMRSNAVNCMLTAVAICDLGTMLSYLTYLVHFVLGCSVTCTSDPSYTWIWFAAFHVFISIYFHSASLWLLVALAYMRVVTLRQRALFSPWHTTRRALKCAITVSSVVFLMCMPNLMHQKIEKTDGYECSQGNTSTEVAERYAIVLSETALNFGCRWLKIQLFILGGMFKVIPCILLVILSMMLIGILRAKQQIHRSLRRYSTVSLTAKQQGCFWRPDSTTFVLLGILLVFLITELPQGILTVAGGFYTEDIYFYIYGGIADVMDLMSLINSSVNFILYCLMSSQYRNAFWKALSSRSRQREQSTRSLRRDVSRVSNHYISHNPMPMTMINEESPVEDYQDVFL